MENGRLQRSQTNVWIRACHEALRELSGRGSVEQITHLIAGARPTRRAFWREAIRKALRNFDRVDHGVYALPQSPLAA